MQQQCIMKPVRTLGLPDSFVLQGTQTQMYKEHGLDAEGITDTIRSLLS